MDFKTAFAKPSNVAVKPLTAAQLRKFSDWLPISLVVHVAAGVLHVSYGVETHTGLGGYLWYDLQMNTFGHASPRFTVFLGVVILVAIPLGILELLKKLFPPLQNMLRESVMLMYSGGLSWKAIVSVPAIVLLLTVCAVALVTANRGKTRSVYEVDLENSRAVVPKSAKFVELTGVLSRRYLTGYRMTQTGRTQGAFVLAPVTGLAWSPADPVRYFFCARINSNHARAGLPPEFEQRKPGKFKGEISRTLPALIK